MNFIQQQLDKQQNKNNNKLHGSKKPPTKLTKPSKNFKPMRVK